MLKDFQQIAEYFLAHVLKENYLIVVDRVRYFGHIQHLSTRDMACCDKMSQREDFGE